MTNLEIQAAIESIVHKYSPLIAAEIEKFLRSDFNREDDPLINVKLNRDRMKELNRGKNLRSTTDLIYDSRRNGELE